jgi:hypothetical protein
MSTEEEGFGINTPLSVLLIRFHPLFWRNVKLDGSRQPASNNAFSKTASTAEKRKIKKKKK